MILCPRDIWNRKYNFGKSMYQLVVFFEHPVSSESVNCIYHFHDSWRSSNVARRTSDQNTTAVRADTTQSRFRVMYSVVCRVKSSDFTCFDLLWICCTTRRTTSCTTCTQNIDNILTQWRVDVDKPSSNSTTACRVAADNTGWTVSKSSTPSSIDNFVNSQRISKKKFHSHTL